MLSLQIIYPDWARNFTNYSEQGNLFEKVVEEICSDLFSGWTVYRAGWSPDNTKNIPAIVDVLCEHLHTKGAINLDDWTDESEKDGGLDIVCYRKFADQREAMPTYFLQCASGKNWREKVHTPNPNTWQKYLDSAVQPGIAIVVPLVIESKELRKYGLRGQVVIIDRLRMLDVVHSNSLSLPDDMNIEIIDWVEKRAVTLPQVN